MGQPSEAGASLGCEWILRGSQGGREPGRDKPLAHGLRAGQRLRGRAQESEDSKWVQEARGSLTHSSGQPKGHRLQRGLSHNLKHPGGGAQERMGAKGRCGEGLPADRPREGAGGDGARTGFPHPEAGAAGAGHTWAEKRPMQVAQENDDTGTGTVVRQVAWGGQSRKSQFSYSQPPQEQGSGQRSGGVT